MVPAVSKPEQVTTIEKGKFWEFNTAKAAVKIDRSMQRNEAISDSLVQRRNK